MGTLHGYNEIVPGAAGEIIQSFVDESRTTNDVRLRTAKGEQFSTVASSLAIPIVQVLSIGATVFLAIQGHPGASVLTAAPFVGLTISQVTFAFRRRNDDD